MGLGLFDCCLIVLRESKLAFVVLRRSLRVLVVNGLVLSLGRLQGGSLRGGILRFERARSGSFRTRPVAVKLFRILYY